VWDPGVQDMLLRRARTVDILVHHAPFPFVDVVSGLLPNDVGLIVYWHADIVGYTWLKSLVTPAIKRTLQRANRIVVSDRSVLENPPLLAPLVEKCAVARAAWMWISGVMRWRSPSPSGGF
jgi:hypothetical protein